MYSFEFPYFLLLIFVFIFSHFFLQEKIASFYFPHLELLHKNKTNNFLLKFLKFFAIFLAIIALCSPIKKLDTQIIKNNGIDIVLNLDTSYSMRAIGFNENDQEQNRWQAVSLIVKDFIKQRINDNIALVVFGSSVMTASPLSYDKNAQSEIISYLDIGIVGEKTAMLDSLATSIKILKTSKSKSKIIVLLTDGEDTASQIPLSVIIKLANKYDIKIYTISISKRKIRILDKISSSTSAKAFIAKNSNSLTAIYNEINTLEKSKLDNNKVVLKEYYYFYPLFFSILFFILFAFIKNRK